jgi:hypothetical protein
VGKAGDAYHIAAKDGEQQAGKEAFPVTYYFIHAVGVLFDAANLQENFKFPPPFS